ncbi:MAG: hypothetical protein PHX98_03625, partial [Candidatus Moranbacteria bacterium]|nr:hypothetical protein [Candidatus Moranbacteria bacterium]
MKHKKIFFSFLILFLTASLVFKEDSSALESPSAKNIPLKKTEKKKKNYKEGEVLVRYKDR